MNVSAFQRDYSQQYGLKVTGKLDDKTRVAIRGAHNGVADRIRPRLGIELRKGQSGDKPMVSKYPEGNKAACASASASQPCGVEGPMHA